MWVSGRQPVAGDDHEVLDADAAEALTIDARLDGHHVPDLRAARRRDRSSERVLVDRRGRRRGRCRGVNQSPQPAAAIASRQAASTLAGGRRRRATAATPARLGLEDQRRRASACSARRLADHERAGHVGVVAVDERAEVDDHGVALDDACVARAVVRAGGVAGPLATIVSKLGPSAPSARIRCSSGVADVGLGRAARRAAAPTSASAASAMAAGRGDAGHLAGVLGRAARPRPTPSAADERRGRRRGRSRGLGVGDVLGLEAERRRRPATAATRCVVDRRPRWRPTSDVGRRRRRRPAGRRRLVAVAAVGDERAARRARPRPSRASR